MGGTIPAAHTLLIDCDADCLESFYESTRGTWAAVLLRLISRTRFLLTLAIRWVWFDRLGISFAEIVERLTGHNRREAVACPLETRDDARDAISFKNHHRDSVLGPGTICFPSYLSLIFFL